MRDLELQSMLRSDPWLSSVACTTSDTLFYNSIVNWFGILPAGTVSKVDRRDVQFADQIVW